MIKIDSAISAEDLLPSIERIWERSAICLRAIEKSSFQLDGAPVFTINGKYVAQGWTEWTQGFQYGSEFLQFDATDEVAFFESGLQHTKEEMAPHVSHIGVHDHGFNNVSTYGAILRLMNEGRIEENQDQRNWCELALKISGSVQASRWSRTHDGGGYIYSFNGPHSLFCDTIRSLRSLALAHRLRHRFQGENDADISLLKRLVQHARKTSKYNVYFGEGRDLYDVRGRVAHESLFNMNDGRYRCPSSQQGYSPFTTWTRGAAWIIAGYPEQLEYIATVSDSELEPLGGRESIESMMLETAMAASDYYIKESPVDGVPYWDTGAPGLASMDGYRDRPADPFNAFEPVDSSAAAIAVQGLLRLANCLNRRGDETQANRYRQAGFTVLRTLLAEPYLNQDDAHEGLLLHSLYHRPRGWDAIPEGQKVPCNESCMWGDYHLREAALYVQRLATNGTEYTFFGPEKST